MSEQIKFNAHENKNKSDIRLSFYNIEKNNLKFAKPKAP